MIIKKLSLTEALEEHAAFDSYVQGDKNSGIQKKRMARFLKKALNAELTERRRQCITAYYIDKKPVADIARELGIRPTTVYKHIRQARNLLKSKADYFLI